MTVLAVVLYGLGAMLMRHLAVSPDMSKGEAVLACALWPVSAAVMLYVDIFE